MSDSTAIGMVSESLRALLLDDTRGMQLEPAVPVTLLAPDEAGDDRRINLFLYKVAANPALRNQDWRPSPSNPANLQPPPLALNLSYLLTAYAPNDVELGNVTEHAILGVAMRVFHENPVMPRDVGILTPGLENAREDIKISLNAINLEELSSVWTTFEQPMRLSVLYDVSVVELDQQASLQRPMARRVNEVMVPAIEQPYDPPVVVRIEPSSGPASSTLTASGAHLDGWRASATVLRRTILDAVEITGDSFAMTLPLDLAPGFHRITINVSGLHRSTFFFEITP